MSRARRLLMAAIFEVLAMQKQKLRRPGHHHNRGIILCGHIACCRSRILLLGRDDLRDEERRHVLSNVVQ